MSRSTGVEVMAKALDFLSNIKESYPASVKSFVALELTGDQVADQLLSEISLMMLQKLKVDGMVKTDDLSEPNAKIYGLTEHGVEMRRLFLELTHA
ncbi:hypothetical protein DQ400_09420 [Vreelandella sulfidaeris]|uniref:Transcriptional regulator n=1 Tax=Vreelandella sulfidaeris TaxID=115553 RepID=A0A365TNX7_9GAMM|nr:hypothetical protein [Halomonas sulfidaeris]RBI67357.1 hypothetical protein DQ400_09420 [Halomonas sulfidaeris]|tara:strand:+ start:778 stop:1065 length:288 start_codon:yes stop_codon:yes gene_type:complete